VANKNSIKFTTILKVPFYLFIGWTIGFGLFSVRLPVPYENEKLTADAIVVLTGGPRRLEAGIKLLSQGRANKMLVTGVHKNVLPRELSVLTGAEPALFDCCITLDYAATNTLGNAVETAKWSAVHGAKSLILVTADFHIQRSAVLFRKSMPRMAIIPYPVKSKISPFKLIKEYNKYLATLMLELVGY